MRNTVQIAVKTDIPKINAGRKVAERKAKDHISGRKSQRRRIEQWSIKHKHRKQSRDDKKTWHLPPSALMQDDEGYALTITSNFSPKAHYMVITPGVIIDSGTTAHLSLNRSKFLNYREITPELIQAADRHTFNALGKAISKLNCQWETMRNQHQSY